MAQTLLSNGYTDDKLKVLRGGYTSWQSLGYPVESSAPAPAGTPGAIQIQPSLPGAAGGGITVMTVVPGAPAPPAP